LEPENTEATKNILRKLEAYPHLYFAGFLAHAGHTYQGRTLTAVQQIYDQSLATLLALKSRYIDRYPGISISLGDTPGSSMVSHLGAVDELRPGNFVFYDLMQHEIGACSLDDIAVAMACPIVAVHPERKQWVLYGGAIHFSKDYLSLPDGRKCFGRMVTMEGASWSTANAENNPFIISLSQEHGIVQCKEHQFDLCKPGDLTLWLPVHSCLTADAMGAYVSTEGVNIDHYRQHVY
jgi:D-serine deaminase-like pyridoxal phosphate-dependent protein